MSTQNIFVNEGDYWTIAYQGQTFRMKNSKGLVYLALLVAQPGREWHVVELAAGSSARTPPAGADARSLADQGLFVGGLGDAGEMLDPQAKAAYRNRISDLEKELEEAESFNDTVRAERAQAEIDALAQQLSAAFGIGGRARKAGSVSERARVNVRNSIALAIKAIARKSPALAEHFTKAVRTGTFCWYVSDGATWSRTNHPQAPAGSLSIVIVDDHPMWRHTLRTVLEGSGTGRVVAEAADGAEAVRMTVAVKPDTVIMDMNLPVLNGVEATRRIHQEVPSTTILMLSSSDERRDVVDAVKAGASGYLVKTASPDEVADAVRRIHAGELVFPPALAKVVLDEFRSLGNQPRR